MVKNKKKVSAKESQDTNDAPVSMDNFSELADRVDKIESQLESGEIKVTGESSIFQDLLERLGTCEQKLKTPTLAKVAQIDLNRTFEDCLRFTLESTIKAANMQNIMEDIRRAKPVIKDAVKLALVLQEVLIEEFNIEKK